MTIIYLAVTAMFAAPSIFVLSKSSKTTTMKLTVSVLTVLFLGIVILPHSGKKSRMQETVRQCKVPAREVALQKTSEAANNDQKTPESSSFSGKHANTVFFIL